MMGQIGQMGGGGRRGKLRGLLSGNPLAGMNSSEIDALMQNGGLPSPGAGSPAHRPTSLPRKNKNKKKSKGRRR